MNNRLPDEDQAVHIPPDILARFRTRSQLRVFGTYMVLLQEAAAEARSFEGVEVQSGKGTLAVLRGHAESFSRLAFLGIRRFREDLYTLQNDVVVIDYAAFQGDHRGIRISLYYCDRILGLPVLPPIHHPGIDDVVLVGEGTEVEQSGR